MKKKSSGKIKWVLLGLVSLLVVGFAYASWFFSGEIVKFATPTFEEQLETEKFPDLSEFGIAPDAVEDIEFTAFERGDLKEGDEITLSGWLIRGKVDDAPVFVVTHGQANNRIGAVKYAGMLARAGYGVLLFDMRCHGRSEGDFCTYGYHERYDVSAAIDYLESRGDLGTDRVGIIGESMGGTIAVMAAAADPRINLLIADSPFLDLPTIISDQAKALYGLPKFPLVHSALFLAGMRAHFTPAEVSPFAEIEKVKVPTLIVQCDEDDVVNPEYAKMIFDRSGAKVKEYRLFSGCGHGMGYEDYTAEYEELVLGFIKKHIYAK
jgi:dipeptidyl aminopeptidase/acylaminoacyl peptidase